MLVSVPFTPAIVVPPGRTSASLSHLCSFGFCVPGPTAGRPSKVFGALIQHAPRKKRIVFLDVNPICYSGKTRSLKSFGYWVTLLFSEVSHGDPVVAVFDGNGGNEYRRTLLPSYKAQRTLYNSPVTTMRHLNNRVGASQLFKDVLAKCDIPVVRVDGYEADDVVATLSEQVLLRGYKVVIASPDKDFKQLISDDVEMVMPIPELKRWSFYTIKHYIAQHKCHPQSDLSLRCIMGDDVDNVPGIQTMVPGFGRKTALKLLQKHGTLENLLNVAAIQTVGKQYAQDALTKHAAFLRKNYEVLALRRDLNIGLDEGWLNERDKFKDISTLSNILSTLEGSASTIAPASNGDVRVRIQQVLKFRHINVETSVFRRHKRRPH